MKKGKAFYNLIFLALAVLSLGLICFSISPGIIVKADSAVVSERCSDNEHITVSDYCTSANTYVLNNYSLPADSVSLSNIRSFIFKLEQPSGCLYYPDFGVYHGRFYFQINTLISSTIESEEWSFPYVTDSAVLNTEFNVTVNSDAYEGLAPDYCFQYIQVAMPYTWGEHLTNAVIEKFELLITSSKTNVTYKPQLVYIVDFEGNDYSGGEKIHSFNYDFNVPVVNSIDELSSDIEYHYATFYGNTVNSLDVVKEYKWFLYNDVVYSDLTIEQIFEDATLEIKNHYTNKYSNSTGTILYVFEDWNMNMQDLTDYTQDYSIYATYKEASIIRTLLNFYGADGELIYSESPGWFEGGYAIPYSGKLVELESIVDSSFVNATNVAKQLNNNSNYESSYYCKVFTNWSATEGEIVNCIDLTINTEFSINGDWNYEYDNYNLYVYNKNQELIDTLNIKSGTTFGELDLTAEEISFYKFKHFGIFTPGLNGYHIVTDDRIISSDLHVQPYYEYIGVNVEVWVSKVLNAEFDNNEIYNKFTKELLLKREMLVGESLNLPLASYYQGFTPKFWFIAKNGNVIEDVTTENYLNVEARKLGNYKEFNSIKVPEGLERKTMVIQLVYTFEPSELITTTPTLTPSELESANPGNNNSNIDLEQEGNKNNNAWIYVLISIGSVVIVVSVTTLIIFLRRGKYGKEKPKTKTKKH